MPKGPYAKMGDRCFVGSYCELPKRANPFDDDPIDTYILIPAKINPNYLIPDDLQLLFTAQSTAIGLRTEYENKIKKLDKRIYKLDARINNLVNALPPNSMDFFAPDEYID